MTEFTFAPGEKNIIGDRFSPSVIIFWLKTSIAASSTRIQYTTPNTLFGLIPLGADTKTIPLRNVASVDTSTKFNLGSLVWGVVHGALVSSAAGGGMDPLVMRIESIGGFDGLEHLPGGDQLLMAGEHILARADQTGDDAHAGIGRGGRGVRIDPGRPARLPMTCRPQDGTNRGWNNGLCNRNTKRGT